MTNAASLARSPLPLLGLLATSLFASGCVVKDTRPLPKIAAVQATQQIPDNDVAIHEFEPGIPKELAEDEDALAKRRIYPDVRKAEAKMLPATLRTTLEASGQWGAVRVVPQSVQFVDVIVTGRKSDKALYSPTLVTFEDDKGAYDQKDAAGFIKLNALRLRTLGARRRKMAKSSV